MSLEALDQFKFEFVIILMLSNLILVFALISDVQSLVARGFAKSTAAAHSNTASRGTVTAHVASATITTQAATNTTQVLWPLKGMVTTEFGVPEPPYQPHHTGIDISSGQPPGRTSVTPFRVGIVLQTVTSSYGLGNHVIVGHGGGITSYYCHLNSIAVSQGQTVKPGDVLGYEGTTGATTGPHVHFEIRQNNIPVNPRDFISGNPR